VDQTVSLTIKFIHAGCAFLSIPGFSIRGYLKIERHAEINGLVFKVLPHVIGSFLLASAITLVVMFRQYPVTSP